MAQVRSSFKRAALVLLAVLGLTSFAAASAQAITWDVNGTEIKSDESIGGALRETGKILMAGLNIEIRCTSMDGEEGSRLRATENDALVFIQFLGCTTHLISTGAEQKSCAPTVLLFKFKTVPFLHNGAVKLLTLPETGKSSFGQIDFPGACALTETNNVSGSFVFECENGSLVLRSCSFSATKQFVRPVSSAVQTKLYPTDVLKFGAQTVVLDGEGELFLTGASEGKTFNALI